MSIGAINIGLTVSAENMSADIGRLLDNMGGQLSAGARKAGQAAGEETKAGILGGIKQGFGIEIASRLFDGAVAAVQGIANTLVSTIQNGMALAGQLVDTSLATGLSAESVLKLKEAAAQTGVSFDQLAASVNKTWLTFGNAQAGEATAVAAFQRVGLSVSDLQGLGPEQIFQRVSEALSGIPNGAEAAAAGVDLMGKTAVSLVPALAAISESVTEQTLRWQRLGGAVTESQIAAAEGMGDSIGLVTETFDRFSIMLASQFAPWIEWGLAQFDAWVISSGGMTNAADLLGKKFVDVGAWVADAAQILYGMGKIGFAACKGISKGVEIIIAAVGWLGSTWTDVFGQSLAIAGILLGKLGAGFRGLVEGFANLLVSLWNGTASLITNGINLVLAAYNKVARFVKVLPQIDLLDGNTGALREIKLDTGFLEDFGGSLEDFGNSLSDSAGNMADSFASVLSGLADEAAGLLDDVASGIQNVQDATNNTGWGAKLKSGLTAAAKDVAENTAKALTPKIQQPYSQAAAAGTAYQPKTNYSAPTASQNFNRIGPAQEPIQINQRFETGVTAQNLKDSAAQTKRETLKAVETAVGRGGNFARNIQC